VTEFQKSVKIWESYW